MNTITAHCFEKDKNNEYVGYVHFPENVCPARGDLVAPHIANSNQDFYGRRANYDIFPKDSYRIIDIIYTAFSTTRVFICAKIGETAYR